MSNLTVSSTVNSAPAATTSKEKDLKDNNSVSAQSNNKQASAKKKKPISGAVVNGGGSGVPVNSKVYFFSSECKYSVIIDRVKELDWRLVEGEKYESRVNLIWVDVSTIHEHFRTIQPWQVINHFPGMPNIARKNRMGQNLNKMLKLFPKEYSFYPKTWILPGEMVDFRQQFDSNGNSIGNKIYIIKPDAGCQGRGIFLTRTFDNVPTQENVVAQVYIKKPLLLDGFKFDLRLYCLVSSVRPLRMYLFHDGLVRMCTEEYVKPTKQNINNVCMHLTNYAVNKHNENFQQPSAASSEESQDGDSKRSLLWFMNFIRKEHGDSKADWLWQRMGILCTRTILSIVPILSREYEAHFKSFSTVPVDISSIPTSGYSNSTGDSSSDQQQTGEAKKGDGNNVGDRSNSEQDDGNKSPRMPKLRGSRCFEILGFDVMIDSNLKPWIIEVNHLPSFGTDSLLDKDIKERLMEQVFSVLPVMADDQQAYIAYHKAESEKRLVQSKNKGVMSDNISKSGSKPSDNKMTKSGTFGDSNRPKNGLTLGSSSGKFSDGTASAVRKEKTITLGRAGGDGSSSSSSSVDKFATKPSNGSSNSDQQNEYTSKSAPDLWKQQPQDQQPHGDDNSTVKMQYPDDNDIDIIYEECTPERLLEIKTILIQIYQKYSPEKTSKIDRLLAKYVGHEEEFLRFVYVKYDVKPEFRSRPPGSRSNSYGNNVYNAAGGTSTDQPVNSDPRGSFSHGSDSGGIAMTSQQHEQETNAEDGEDDGQQGENDQDEGNESNDNENHNDFDFDSSSLANEGSVYVNVNDSSDSTSVAVNQSLGNNPKPPAANSNNSLREQRGQPKMRFSRSVSPPRSSTPHGNRRAPAAWKLANAEEDSAFRSEVLAAHVPDENEDWMQFELSRLSQFTRIFPAGDPRFKSKGQSHEDIDRDEDNDNDDNDENAEEKDKEKEKDKPEKEKPVQSASYEEILFQVFMQDRRQTMRLHCPLPNRGIEKDNGSSSSLPLIDSSNNTSRTSSSTMSTQSAKGVVGWKAPPKPVRKEIVRQPTQTQADAAKRLSQGLSVSASAQRDAAVRQRNSGISNNLFHCSSTNFSGYPPNGIILDPQEYPQHMYISNMMNQGPTNGINVTSGVNMENVSLGGFEMQAENGLPSTKSAKLIEECRINRLRLEAVRQANNAAVLRQQVFHFDPNYYPYFNSNGGGMGSDMVNSNVVNGFGGGNGLVMAQNAAGGGYGSSSSSVVGDAQYTTGNRGSVSYVPGANGGNNSLNMQMNSNNNNANKARPAVSNATNGNKAAINGSNGVSVNNNAAVGGDHTQEELLRQLFPSWF